MANPSLQQHQLLLTIEETACSLSLSRAQLFRLRAAGDFPEPLRLLGPASHPRWRPSDLLAYLERKVRDECQHG